MADRSSCSINWRRSASWLSSGLSKPSKTVTKPTNAPTRTDKRADQTEEARQQAVERAGKAEAEIERLRRLLDATGQSGESR